MTLSSFLRPVADFRELTAACCGGQKRGPLFLPFLERHFPPVNRYPAAKARSPRGRADEGLSALLTWNTCLTTRA